MNLRGGGEAGVEVCLWAMVTAGGCGEAGFQLSPALMQVLCLIFAPIEPAILAYNWVSDFSDGGEKWGVRCEMYWGTNLKAVRPPWSPVTAGSLENKNTVPMIASLVPP